ncbi:MAG: flagellar motor switch protein FliN [Sphingomonadales bacterium]|nr:flagellar motor switch protein FliN [Sphingomonadales bacterium]
MMEDDENNVAEDASEGVNLEDVSDGGLPPTAEEQADDSVHSAQDLEAVFDVPVNVQAVLGKSHLEVSQLLKLGAGAVIELDRKVGEAIDIYVNDRLVARGEVVLVDDHLGVTMTEIIKSGN